MKTPHRVTVRASLISAWPQIGNCLWWFGGACFLPSHRYTDVLIASNRKGQPIGILVFKLDKEGEIDFSRAVHPRSRRKGVAALLLKTLVNDFGHDHALTCTSIHSWMWPSLNRCGFTPDYASSPSGGGQRSLIRRPIEAGIRMPFIYRKDTSDAAPPLKSQPVPFKAPPPVDHAG